MADPRSRNKESDLPDIHMNTAKGLTMAMPDIRMATAKGMTIDKDIRMDTAKPGTTLKHGPKMWEKELLDSSEVRRKATVAQLCQSYFRPWCIPIILLLLGPMFVRSCSGCLRFPRLLLQPPRLHRCTQGPACTLRPRHSEAEPNTVRVWEGVQVLS